MKGIILAGGSGTRLHPLTISVSKQLLPVYNKPMIYYPLSTLLLAGIRDILIITTPHDQAGFKKLLGDGSSLGVKFTYAIQDQPNGLAEAFIIGEDFIGKDNVCLILGDNIFHGNQMVELLKSAVQRKEGATIFGYEVKNPQRYGVVEVDDRLQPIDIVEKPTQPKSNIAVTGLYFFDNQVVEIAKNLKPSLRGELEITDVNREYIKRKQIHLALMGRGYAWLDAGTYSSLMQASQFVEVLEEREGSCIASIEEAAFLQGFITAKQLQALGEKLGKSPYGNYLIEVAKRSENSSLRYSYAG
ncbi:MAG: glucose-1-phosphate thymidylyltransferase RfbA [Parachlamydiales bacterium]|jgi:glucose-1-phosphate thymidylyltransferase